ncbi:hypothetical protein HAX54_040373 [Datura stramonium]|uniref:Uncharacterized protein n=1 Tax=Datura stramonium TaxID=4076 RepID=A0ABS8VQN9_DATST|nr:hypothetical protein [Datura stramonium]
MVEAATHFTGSYRRTHWRSVEPSLPFADVSPVSPGIEEYYMTFKEKRSIHAETQFEVEPFKTDFANIYYQIGMRDWGPFTILVDPYFPKLVWEFYASYKAWKCLQKHKVQTNTMPCLPSIWVRGQEVPITPEAINSLYWAEPIQPNSVFHRKLEKAIPSMIQQAIKKAMQPARDKLRGLCTTIEVLENDVIALRKDVATLIGPPPTSNPTPPEPAAVTP